MHRAILKYAQAILIMVLVAVSGYLAYEDMTGTNVCLPGAVADCATVQNSVYGTIFGIKLSYFGLAAFIVLALVYIGAKIEHARKETMRKLFLAISIIGALFALYFLYVQFFVLQRLCTNCILIDSLMIVVFLLSLAEFIIEMKEK